MSGTLIAYVSSIDVPLCRHSTRLCAQSSSSTLIFPQNARCSTHTYHSRRQKFCCLRTAWVEQFSGYYKTDHQLRTVQATSENTFIYGLEIAAHCNSRLLCVYKYSYLLTYLLTFAVRRCSLLVLFLRVLRIVLLFFQEANKR